MTEFESEPEVDEYVGKCWIRYETMKVAVVLLASDMAVWGLQLALSARPELEVIFPVNGIINGKTRDVHLVLNPSRVEGLRNNLTLRVAYVRMEHDPVAFNAYAFGSYFRQEDDKEGIRLVPLVDRIAAKLDWPEGAGI